MGLLEDASISKISRRLIRCWLRTQNPSLLSPARGAQIVLDWLAKLLALPPAFLSRTADGREAVGGGVIQGTASEATVVALLAARTRALKGRPAQDACRLVVYTSDQVRGTSGWLCSLGAGLGSAPSRPGHGRWLLCAFLFLCHSCSRAALAAS